MTLFDPDDDEVRDIAFEAFEDERGLWTRAWDASVINSLGHNSEVAQVSYSLNPTAGTLRGLHYLVPEANETKSVFVITGEIQDVVVDVRPNSNRYLKSTSRILLAGMGLTIPPGFAHGFLTLSENVTLSYVMSTPYSPEYDRGLAWDDPALEINWVATPKLISVRDASHPYLVHE